MLEYIPTTALLEKTPRIKTLLEVYNIDAKLATNRGVVSFIN